MQDKLVVPIANLSLLQKQCLLDKPFPYYEQVMNILSCTSKFILVDFFLSFPWKTIYHKV